MRGGELGSIPALVGLIVITVVFAVVHQGFLSAYNIEALVIQAAPIIVMAMGLVFVLLLGEIDLSAGTTAGPRDHHNQTPRTTQPAITACQAQTVHRGPECLHAAARPD